MLRNRHRRDRNHSEIETALRRVTHVVDAHNFGGLGFDLIARHIRTGLPVFLEVKDGAAPPSARQLTASEVAAREAWPASWRLVLTLDDALAAVGIDVRRSKSAT